MEELNFLVSSDLRKQFELLSQHLSTNRSSVVLHFALSAGLEKAIALFGPLHESPVLSSRPPHIEGNRFSSQSQPAQRYDDLQRRRHMGIKRPRVLPKAEMSLSQLVSGDHNQHERDHSQHDRGLSQHDDRGQNGNSHTNGVSGREDSRHNEGPQSETDDDVVRLVSAGMVSQNQEDDDGGVSQVIEDHDFSSHSSIVEHIRPEANEHQLLLHHLPRSDGTMFTSCFVCEATLLGEQLPTHLYEMHIRCEPGIGFEMPSTDMRPALFSCCRKVFAVTDISSIVSHFHQRHWAFCGKRFTRSDNRNTHERTCKACMSRRAAQTAARQEAELAANDFTSPPQLCEQGPQLQQ